MLKLKERYFVKIIPQRGDLVHRFEITRKHILTVASVAGIILAATVFMMVHARAQVAALQTLTGKQLRTIDQRATVIHHELQQVQREDQEIKQLIGVPPKSRQRSDVKSTSYAPALRGKDVVAQLSNNVDKLAAASAVTLHESQKVRSLALRVLNVRHMRELERAQMLAAIPSIDPVAGAAVVGCFCYRTSPDVGFHPGVDLGADEGEVVRASAAGTVASADWDGGFGQKIDIDHGNGYHTWYAHLSRMEVSSGQFVRKGQEIGLVGETGFATGPHLHYQVMLNGKAVDPTPFLSGVPSNVLASLP